MLSVSVGCTNPNTYGLSCTKCGVCGRKFTMQGVDDSEVVSNKIEPYKRFLNSEEWQNITIQIGGKLNI